MDTRSYPSAAVSGYVLPYIFRGRSWSLQEIEMIKGALGEVILRIANKRTSRNLWEYLIDKYHYLGYKRPVGTSVKYLIYSDERLVD